MWISQDAALLIQQNGFVELYVVWYWIKEQTGVVKHCIVEHGVVKHSVVEYGVVEQGFVDHGVVDHLLHLHTKELVVQGHLSLVQNICTNSVLFLHELKFNLIQL